MHKRLKDKILNRLQYESIWEERHGSFFRSQDDIDIRTQDEAFGGLQSAILVTLDSRFFEDHAAGLSEDELLIQLLSKEELTRLYEIYMNRVPSFGDPVEPPEISGSNKNDVKMALLHLEHRGLIERDEARWKITVLGSEQFGEIEHRREQRVQILRILNETYQRDVDEFVSHTVLIDRLGLSGPGKILPQMRFLGDCGYVKFNPSTDGTFDARLRITGLHVLEGLDSPRTNPVV